MIATSLSKGGVLGKKPVTGMNGVGTTLLAGINDILYR
jgi:hypothetical protein